MTHPNAADTPEGFARWRLLEDAVRRGIAETEAALAWLVEEGFLKEAPVAGGAPIFALNPNRLADAERFLSTSQGEPNGRR